MTLFNSLLNRAPLIFVALAAALGIIGNLAPGVVAEVSGYALFGLVLTSPGIAIFGLRRSARMARPATEGSFARRVVSAIALAILAIIGAMVAIFGVVALGKIIGQPGTDRYPDTLTRVLIISVATGALLLSPLARVLWQSTGPRKHYRRAVAKLAAGEFLAALDHLEAYAESRPNDPLVWEGLALSLFGLSRHEQALEAADRGLALRRRWQGLLFRGQILMALGAGEEALADLTECHRRKRLPLTQMLIGSVLMGFRRMDQALEQIQKSNRSVRASFAFALMGDAHRLAGHAAAAESAYREAESRALQEIAAGPPLGWPVLASARLHLGDFDGAMEAVAMSLEAFPDDAVVHCTRAMIYTRRGEGGAAITALTAILPGHPSAVVGTLTDPANTHLLAEARFRQLLAWAMGAQRVILQRVRSRPAALVGASAPS